MERSGGERRVDEAGTDPPSPVTVLEFLVPQLAAPAAVLDDEATVVAANDELTGLTGVDGSLRGETLSDHVPALTPAAVAENSRTTGEYVTVRTGADRWLDFGFERYGSYVLCLGHDVTDRQAVAETAAAVQRATGELLVAPSRDAVAKRLVAAATEALALSGATVYLFDACRNVLWPAGVSGAAGTDERRAVGVDDDSVVCDAFLDRTEQTVESGDRYRPLGDYGVLHTVAGDGHGTARSGARGADAHELLVRGARAALERLDRTARLRDRETVADEQADRITELERMLGVLRRVHRTLVDADGVAGVEQRVCEALAASDWVSFAWLGRADGERVEPRAWAGRHADYLEAVSLSTADPDGPPAVRTARADGPTTVDAIADGIGERGWHTAALARDFQSVVSVPLRVDGVGNGVLSVYADRPIAFGESLTAVVAEIGDSVATALHEQELRSRYTRDSAVELELTVSAPDSPLGRLATELGTTLHGEEVIPIDDAETRLFVRVPETDEEGVADAVATVQHVDSVVAVAETGRYELLAREPTVVGQLVRRGARLDDVRVADGELELTVVLASDTDVRQFIDRTATLCEDVQLTARREGATTRSRPAGVRDSLDAQLTDRQLEVLRTAYHSGFFEWPRTTTGEGVAEMLGVSQPTVNRHLRVSQRKLLELVFDDV